MMPFRTIQLGGVSLLVVLRDDCAPFRMLQAARNLFKRTQPEKRDDGSTHRQPVAASVKDEPPLDRASTLARIDELEWYHSVDLGDGIVTPGMFDHTPLLSHYGLPERMDGMRVLDVATMDGYWAFEFERRGAKEVIAMDIDRVADVDLKPAVRGRLSADALNTSLGTGFRYAKRALDSNVRRETLSVYDLCPEKLGMFDFVFVGSLLLHLMNPIKALQNVASVTKGHAIIAEAFHPALPQPMVTYEGGSQRSVWWCFGANALERMIRDAGFRAIERVDEMAVPARVGPPVWHAVFRAYS